MLIAAFVLLMPASSAQATFPGLNGKIAFSSNTSGNYDIYTVNPDGTGLTNLTNSPEDEVHPAWSPDGKKIAFSRYPYLWTMNADGSGQSQPSTPFYAYDPAWSPDGQKFAAGDAGFEVFRANSDGSGHFHLAYVDEGDPQGLEWSPDGQVIVFSMYVQSSTNSLLVTIKPDGSDFTDISQDATIDTETSWYPTWSPDGTKIAYAYSGIESSLPSGIYTVNPDGSGHTLINSSVLSNEGLAWSPDKTKIASAGNVGPGSGALYIMNADGTGAAAVPGVSITGVSWLAGRPDWQPLKPPGYARPKSATPATIRLVPAQTPCSSANATHGAPLALASCNPPQQTSGYATVGTQDVNGAAAKSTGLLTAKAVGEVPINPNNGDQTDIDFTVQVTDVRDKQTPALDYSGELRAAFNLRLTDRYSGPGLIHPATSSDTTFAFTIPCSSTPDPSIGSTCSTSTSADAVMPGITPELTRAVWELGQVQVHDGGSDGDGDTTGDNTLFMTQGLFAP
jgi:hypothetical protein